MFSGLPPKADLGRDPAATVLAIEVLQLAVRQRRIELAVETPHAARGAHEDDVMPDQPHGQRRQHRAPLLGQHLARGSSITLDQAPDHQMLRHGVRDAGRLPVRV